MTCLFFFNYTATTEIYTYGHTLSLHDALPISIRTASRAASGSGSALRERSRCGRISYFATSLYRHWTSPSRRSEEHTSELQSLMRIWYAVFCLKKKMNEHPYTLQNNNTLPPVKIPSNMDPSVTLTRRNT